MNKPYSPRDQSLNDLAVETLADFKEVQSLGAGYNDCGSVLGVRDEIKMIERELEQTLNRCGLRIAQLRCKIEKWEKGERDVDMLKQNLGQSMNEQMTLTTEAQRPEELSQPSGSLAWYLDIKQRVADAGYAGEAIWSQTLQPVAEAKTFWAEFGWVVLNSGMKEQIARKIWNRVRPAVEAGQSAGTVFGHKGKAGAIDYVWANRERLLREYQAAPDKVEWCESLPWIGAITKWHLAKNYGHDCAKPDRHLVRIAGVEGPHALCARLAAETGDRIATVDVVIWRAANLGLLS
jgi:hypothetical protein